MPRLPLSPQPLGVLPYRDRASLFFVGAVFLIVVVPGACALGAALGRALLSVLS